MQVRDPEKVVWLSQTTLSVDETLATVDQLRTRFPGLQSPPSDDICYATQNRQQAVKQMAGECDLVLVVGSTNSSNSVRLVEVALEAGARASHLVDFASEIDEAWLDGVGTVGVTSGASVPEILVSEVLDWLAERGFPDVETVKAAEERLVFALPHELRSRSAARRPPPSAADAAGRGGAGERVSGGRPTGSGTGPGPRRWRCAMVGKPRTSSVAIVGRLNVADGASAMLTPATAVNTSGGAMTHRDQVAAADQPACARIVPPTRATSVIVPRPIPRNESTAPPARVTRKTAITATAPRRVRPAGRLGRGPAAGRRFVRSAADRGRSRDGAASRRGASAGSYAPARP